MSKLRTSILDFLWEAGSYACHQQPERSFFYKGEQFPVCARCTGVAIGQAIFLLTARKWKAKGIFYIFLLIPLCIDVFAQMLNIWESNNRRRFATGLLGGFAVFGIYRRLLTFFLNKIKQ